MSIETALAQALAQIAGELRASLAGPTTLRALLARYGWTADLLDDASTAAVRSAFALGPALAQIQTLADRRKARSDPANRKRPISAEAHKESQRVEPQ